MKESSSFPTRTVRTVLAASAPGEDGASSAKRSSGSISRSAFASVLESRLLREAGFRHAFFTRLGGASAPPWDTLNFSVSVGDSPEAVAENLERAAKILEIQVIKLYFLSQVHGVASRVLDGTEDRDEVLGSVGDITLSRAVGVGCAIRTADCVPILLADRRSGAVAAVHSGWRGTADRVAVVAVSALRDLVGGAGDFIAAIGPHIERCCFEVGEDVAAELASASRLGASAIDRSARSARAVDAGAPAKGPPKPRVDLRRIVRAELEEAGIAEAAIDDVPGCTACDRERFHSFRRDGSRSGRMLSAIVARTP